MFIFENPDDMPIGKGWFADWAEEFNSILNDVSLPSFDFDGIRIEFSNKRESDKYGSMTLKTVKKLIRMTWNVNEKIEDTLSTIRNYHYYRTQMCEVLAREIQEYNPGTEWQTIKETMDGWFANSIFYKKVLGRYVPSEKKIILYTKSILGRKRDADFRSPFIHELFHAYHYLSDIGNGELVKRSDYTGKVVKESLAAAFESMYCKHYGVPGTDEHIVFWESRPASVYPYSGALELAWHDEEIFNVEFDLKKFTEVYKASLTDVDQAMRILFADGDGKTKDMFFEIKNR